MHAADSHSEHQARAALQPRSRRSNCRTALAAAAAVVAMPHVKWGETPCAFIELVAGTEATADDLTQWCKQHLASFKVPRQFVFENIVKTSTGKVQKFILRQQAEKLAGEQNF